MATTTSPDKLSQLKDALSNMIKSQPPIGALAAAHIAAKHQIHSLAAFYATSAVDDATKTATLTEIAKGIGAHLTGKPHGLQGQAPAGHAEPPKPVPAAKPQRVTPDASQPEAIAFPEPVPPPQPKPIPPAPPPTKPVSGGDPLSDRLRELIREIVGPAQVDEERVKGLIATAATNTLACVEKLVASIMAEKPGIVTKLEITHRGQVNTLEGITHRQLPQILSIVGANVPLWLWGPAGGGKTTIGEQVAHGLGLPFYCASMDETTTPGKLCGFKNIANGDHVEGLLYKPFKFGGVTLLDETDLNAQVIAALNAMLANGHYTFGNNERVVRHPDFRVIAGANTKGAGAVAGYVARVRMDAATLDRFAVLELKYDWDMVARITGPSVWGEWVKECSLSFGKDVLISPRAAILGHRLITAGLPAEEVADMLLFKLTAPDTKARILAKHPLPVLEKEVAA